MILDSYLAHHPQAPSRPFSSGYDYTGNPTSKTSAQAGDFSVTAQAFSNGGRQWWLTDVNIGGIANNLQ